jgi:adenylate cyclase
MPRLLITDPAQQTQIFEIASPTVGIGRAASNDLVLDHPSVSRHHARLSALPGDTVLLNDLGSLNGIFVNGAQVQEHRMAEGDVIHIGMFELKYELGREKAVHVETGAATAPDLVQLAAPDLRTALRSPQDAGLAPAPPAASVSPQRLAELERENRLLKLLLGVGKTLSSALQLEDVMHRVMELVFQMENVERGFVMLYDERGGFKPAVLMYKDERLKKDPRGVALSRTMIQRVMTEHLPLLILDVEGDERFSSSESLRLSGIRSAMCAPLIFKDRVFGLFYVDCLSKPYAFSKEELGIFAVIAAEAAISFDSARSHEELSRRALERKALERFLSPAIVEKILANPHEVHLGGENQSATILFSDIRGFTRMSEKMEPAQVVELLNEYFSEMTEIIFENGGTLDKYLGDGIMALFGAPIARVDDAERAVKTAIEMQRALDGLNRQWLARGQPRLEAGVGINTGAVTAGNIGSAQRMDYTVIGDAVNLASRLCALAQGGQILVSDSTFSQLSQVLAARRLEPLRVKGRETPVDVYEIQWIEAETSSTGAALPA